ncbi:MAG TPA: ABC transporter permease, partial [Pyrinomonadaceae bacterium]
MSAVLEAFRVAVSSLRQNKLRTALTLVGIVVGVTAVIAVITIIKGLDQTVASTFNSQGSTVFTISKRPQVITSREDFIKFNKRKDVTREDAEAVFRSCTACWRTGMVANTFEIAKRGDQKFEGVRVRAINTPAMFDIDGVSVESGRLWTDTEGAAAREIAVVGADVVSNLFPNTPADRTIGQEFWVAGHRYTILGVLAPLGKIFGASRDNVIYIPYGNYEKFFGTHDSVVVFIQTQTPAQLEEAQDQARAIMRNRRGKTFGSDDDEGFALETQDVFLNLYSSATSNIYIVTIGVAAISLVVGGIV